jgi:thiamine kinase-like enzyme
MFDLRTNDTSSGLVIKIFGNQTELLIDRQSEKEAMLTLASRQLAKPLLLEFGNGIIYGFTPGVACSREDIKTDEIRSLIARKLGQFHSVPLSDEQRKKGPCLIPVLRKFVAFIERHGRESEKKGQCSRLS